MTTTRQDIELYQGEEKPVTIDVTEGGSPKTMTSMTPEWKMFETAQDDDVDALLSKVPTIQNGDDTDDQLAFTLDPADTASVEPGWYYHEARVTDPGGAQKVVAIGTVEIKPSPTAA